MQQEHPVRLAGGTLGRERLSAGRASGQRRMLPKYEDPVIGSDDLSRFGARLAVDIMRTHPVVIVGGIPQDQFLLELRERGVAG